MRRTCRRRRRMNSGDHYHLSKEMLGPKESRNLERVQSTQCQNPTCWCRHSQSQPIGLVAMEWTSAGTTPPPVGEREIVKRTHCMWCINRNAGKPSLASMSTELKPPVTGFLDSLTRHLADVVKETGRNYSVTIKISD